MAVVGGTAYVGELSAGRRTPAWASCHMAGLKKALPSSQAWGGELKPFVFLSANKISKQSRVFLGPARKLLQTYFSLRLAMQQL